jgi:hypothetical protein
VRPEVLAKRVVQVLDIEKLQRGFIMGPLVGLDDKAVSIPEGTTGSSEISPTTVRHYAREISFERMTLVERRAVTAVDHVKCATFRFLAGSFDATHATSNTPHFVKVIVPSVVALDGDHWIGSQVDICDVIFSIVKLFKNLRVDALIRLITQKCFNSWTSYSNILVS